MPTCHPQLTDNSFSREGFSTLADEANRQGLYLAGHVPDAVSVIKAAKAGMRSIEHARVIPFDCAPGRRRSSRHAVRAYSAPMCKDLFARLVAHHTAYVPTHLTRKMDAFAHDLSYRTDSRLKYITACAKGRGMRDANVYARKRKARQNIVDFYRHGLNAPDVLSRHAPRPADPPPPHKKSPRDLCGLRGSVLTFGYLSTVDYRSAITCTDLPLATQREA